MIYDDIIKLQENTVMANEAIGFQENDPFVDEAVRIYERILDEAVMGINPDSFMKKKLIKDLFAELDLLILKRFKIPTKHISGETFYATIPVAGRGYHVLADNVDKKIEAMIAAIRDRKLRDIKFEDISSYDQDIYEIFGETIKSYNNLHKKLNTEGIVIDEENAKIYGLNADVKIFLVTSTPMLVKHEINPREAVAILLHEIGHIFTHISESYRTVNVVHELLDIVTGADGKINPRQSFRMINKKMFGNPKPKENEVLEVIDFHNKILKKIVFGKHDVQASRESERMADQFTSRFGLGSELSVAMRRINDNLVEEMTIDIISMEGIKRALDIVIIALLLSTVTTAISVILLTMFLTTGIYLLTQGLINMIRGTDKSRETTYDVLRERLIRLRHNEIARLRNVDPSIKPSVLEALDMIDASIKDLSNSRSFMAVLGDKMPWNIKYAEDTQFQRDMESLAYNDFAILAEKIKEVL